MKSFIKAKMFKVPVLCRHLATKKLTKHKEAAALSNDERGSQ